MQSACEPYSCLLSLPLSLLLLPPQQVGGQALHWQLHSQIYIIHMRNCCMLSISSQSLLLLLLLQVGGQAPRWQLYHQVHLLERAVRRMAGATRPGDGAHPFAAHAEWALPVMLRIITCLHAGWSARVLGMCFSSSH